MADKKGASASGVMSAQKMNPNKKTSLNDTPEGPGSHMMSQTDTGGYQGDTACTSKGKTFHFK